MKNQTPWAYYTNKDGQGFHAFNIDTCEKCGCECEAANAVTLIESEKRLQALGLQRHNRLKEFSYCEALTQVVCPDCYVSEENN